MDPPGERPSRTTDPGGRGELSPPSSLAPPERPGPAPEVPDYELLRRVGAGSYGEIWLARSRATGVLRAAKIVWRHHFENDRPFQREFAGIQRFERISREHPSQLALFHIGRNDPAGYFYYVMELADAIETLRSDPTSPSANEIDCPSSRPQDARAPEPGLVTPSERDSYAATSYVPHTLRSDLGSGRLPPAQVLEIGLALTEALANLHSHGLVHRDVKPSNVIFVNGRPKLADIGLVTDAGDGRSIVGTEGYLAPEGPGTPQADLFALGKVLYEAATGFERRRFPRLPPDIRSWPGGELVLELNEIILKACAPKSEERYRRAEDLHGSRPAQDRAVGKTLAQSREPIGAAHQSGGHSRSLRAGCRGDFLRDISRKTIGLAQPGAPPSGQRHTSPQ